jgi:hypothetical protein
VTAGAGLRIRASASAAGILQFTNNAGTAEWATIVSPSSGNITFADGSGVTLGIINEAGYISAYGVDATTVTGPGFGVRVRAPSSGNAIIQFTDIGVTTQLATLTCTSAGVVGVNGLPILTDQGAWSAYTPVLAPLSGSFTTVGSSFGRYIKRGKMCTVSLVCSITNIGTGSGGMTFTLPSGALSGATCVGAGRENAVTGKMLQVYTDGTALGLIYNYDNTTPFENGCQILATLTYETSA